MAKKHFTYRLLICSSLLAASVLIPGKQSFAQDDEDFYTNLLDTVVEVVDPVYKPVISFGTGVMSFWGDVQNRVTSPLVGNYAFRVNGSALFGSKKNFKVNAFALFGNISGHSFELSRQMQQQPLPTDELGNPVYLNSSFTTSMIQIGTSIEYGFGHLIKGKRFRPFLAVGVSTMIYSPKGDFKLKGSPNPDGYYYFWADGTMRNYHEASPNAAIAEVVRFDREYETDLSSANLFKQGTYSQQTVTIPVDAGFDFYLSDRVAFRVGISVNYAFTDMIDNYSSKTAKAMGYPEKNAYSDIFAFNYFSINLDLFSDPKSLLVERLFADIGFDYDVFFADEDNDNVFDRFDLCPNTPPGVEVDSVGCPFDTDNDGVFDYMDIEEGTPGGATVDEQGAQLTPDALAAMFDNVNAVDRKEIRLIPLASIWTASRTFTPGVIPAKFRRVDSNADGYIAFQELLRAIDDYFDGKATFTPDEIYELNDYFFAQ